MSIRLILIDDHAIVRTGIAGMLATEPDLEVVGEASNGQEGIQLIKQVTPDVVLLDLRMPIMDGPTVIESVRRDMGEKPGILVLTTYDTDADILRAIEAGANGYLLKDTSQTDLVQAIRATAQGSSWLAPSIAAQLMKQYQRGETDRLSQRELEVLQLVAEGQSNKEIASHLHVSQATIKTHLINIFRKLDVNDRTAAVKTAIDRGIIY